MSLLSLHNLSKFFGAEEIFSGVNAEIPHRARIALVGPNGAGKTTLLNLLTGEDLPSEGTVTRARNIRIGFLPQRPELEGGHTLWNEQLLAFDDLRAMESRLTRLENDMADPDRHDKALTEYGPLQQEFEHRGGYTYETRIKMVLSGVGFAADDYSMPLTKLSGGEKTRALLARLLLDAPDLLLLDEPTNHLDIDAVEWLENFLRDFPGAVLAVSHDRYFIDAFASSVWDMEFGQIETYRGNYTHYTQQREERRERLLKEYEAQQEFIAKEQEFIRRNIAAQKTAQAKGRLKRLETMRKRGKIIAGPPRQRRMMGLRMQSNLRSGNKVLMTKSLAVGYPDADEPLFTAPDITLWRGETAALIGPNGAGKTTFLKTVIGELQPLSGQSKLGAAVKIGYFAQAHERLDPRNNVLEELFTVKHMPTSEGRNYLGRFLFSGDDVFRPVSTLSGGERGRLALAKLALWGANLLLLDEPTNHLDIDSQEILQGVMESFDGTILIVSHDRYLIDALATQIWAVSPGELVVFEGVYREYITARNRRLEQESVEKADGERESKQTRFSEKKHGLNPYELKQRIGELEAQIETLEARLDELSTAIESASAEGDANRIRELGEEYAQTESELEAALAEWERLEG